MRRREFLTKTAAATALAAVSPTKVLATEPVRDDERPVEGLWEDGEIPEYVKCTVTACSPRDILERQGYVVDRPLFGLPPRMFIVHRAEAVRIADGWRVSCILRRTDERHEILVRWNAVHVGRLDNITFLAVSVPA